MIKENASHTCTHGTIQLKRTKIVVYHKVDEHRGICDIYKC